MKTGEKGRGKKRKPSSLLGIPGSSREACWVFPLGLKHLLKYPLFHTNIQPDVPETRETLTQKTNTQQRELMSWLMVGISKLNVKSVKTGLEGRSEVDGVGRLVGGLQLSW